MGILFARVETNPGHALFLFIILTAHFQGPREISIIRPSAVQAFFGFQSECRKSTWYSQVTADQKKTNLATIRDHDYHRLRRKPWDRAFGPKGMSGLLVVLQEPRLMLV